MMDTKKDTPSVIDVPVNSLSLIRVSRKEYRGETYIDVRLWVMSGRQGTELVPTKRGVMIEPDVASDVHKALGMLCSSDNVRGRSSARTPVRTPEPPVTRSVADDW